MKCVVTGAAGFIGSHVAERLVSEGHDVTGVDAFTDYYDVSVKQRNLAKLRDEPRFTFVESDVMSDQGLRSLEGAEVVFHLAGQPGVRPSWESQFRTYVERNVLVTQAILEAARMSGVGRIVYASSSSVYGNQPAYPCTESVKVQPFSPYGVTKLAGEHLCQLYSENYGLATVALRYFTVYGPRQRPDMAFSKFIRAALAGQPVTVTGDGLQVRDFTYVGDVVAATVAAGSAAVDSGTVLNISGGDSVTVLEVLDMLADAAEVDLRITQTPAVPGDVLRTGGSNDAARAVLGWTPRVGVKEGLRHQVEWEMARC